MKKWGVQIMPLPNVLNAMQSILADTVVLDKLIRSVVEVLPSGASEELELCIVIVESISEVSHAYISALPQQAVKLN